MYVFTQLFSSCHMISSQLNHTLWPTLSSEVTSSRTTNHMATKLARKLNLKIPQPFSQTAQCFCNSFTSFIQTFYTGRCRGCTKSIPVTWSQAVALTPFHSIPLSSILVLIVYSFVTGVPSLLSCICFHSTILQLSYDQFAPLKIW